MSGSIIREKPVHLAPMRQNSVPNGNSPLKLFTQAKTTITDIFKHISTYVNDSNIFLADVTKSDKKLLTVDKHDDLQQLKEKVTRILTIISRDHMKVVFFGRTSNGKSTVMNAMLRERILPAGMGHTTNCFLQIEGTDKLDAYVLVPPSDEPKSIVSLKDLGSALSREKLNSDSLVKILYPKEKCRLLRDDVILVDSPGIDVSANLDQWIEDHCLDADVFVLVVSAEATITVAEKKFLHNVAQRLSNPNIFILMNRWDAIVNEEENVDKVRQQHLERGMEFLCDELHLYDRKVVADYRVFFVSAREAVLHRAPDPSSSPRTGFAEGYKERLTEFTKFEQEFEKCISKAAVRTKFEQHTNRGKEIINLLRDTMVNITDKSHSLKQQTVQKRTEESEKHDFIEKELKSMMETTKDRIRHVSEDVYKRVAQTLNDEIKRLYTLIEEFDRPFSSDPEQIPLYKRDLHKWVEERLGSNLQSRLHSALYSSLDSVHKDIKERVKSVVNNERKSMVDAITPRSDFAVSYRLDCLNLCSDFKEDIKFKFSLGLTSIWQRFVQSQHQQSALTMNKDNSLNVRNDSLMPTSNLLNSTNDLLTTANSITSLTSKSSLLLIGGCALIWRGIGWKVLGVVGCLYGSLYAYERLMWTKKAQERKFKRQYADYASSRMKLIVDMTSGNASAQVQQELSMYFAQTVRYIDMEKDDICDNLKQLKQEIDQLLLYNDRAKGLKKQADWIDQQLSLFSKQYLSEPMTTSINSNG
ncbi:unnamed protein product [Didymodactylos carnosus]|uniref:Dynamin-type G domain-containing protein n=1 Tax=Didymodactylos carnosus TaxID=1234261 RepID=A0A815PEX6_9BILA|nr:unnamed protein product [Didymodactylos carnosus]CAF1448079.1 unnamed protein product [Didymodactylos carnosus]CAF4094804.1 unnamed protein product [Didymodactylos carnosus]CAF4322302.1 unnamed protein product [Didymodactylos carnosus]